MGGLTVRGYLNAAPVIYTVERVSPFVAKLAVRLYVPGFILVASELTRMECRLKPLRMNDAVLLQDYDTFFTTDVREMVQLSRLVMERATDIRAQYGFKTVDAIHLAAAVESKCDVFLTNDLRLNRFTGIKIETP
jgi:uncharacterized protein